MTSLDSPCVRAVLDRLYNEAEKIDVKVIPVYLAEKERLGAFFDERRDSGLLDDAFMPVAPEVGRLFYVLVRALRPAIALEFGTSFGLSAIHIASALRDNGFGRLITTELNSNKATRATENIREAGFGDLVEVRQGDAFETLSDVAEIDFLMLDGWKGLYLPMLKKLEPALNSGSLIVADDLKIAPQVLEPYVNYVRNPENGYTSTELPMDDGLELSIRT